MRAALHEFAGEDIAADDFRALRLWKNREMIRIALREIADVAPLEETTADLSQIAEICIRLVYEHWDAHLRQRHGSPEAQFAILALGKLGGAELNHSSDVDLIFLYSDEGQLAPHFSYHEFFNRLAEKILATFNSTHADGKLFRVDLRLRPEGGSGPLARSLRSMEYYYSGYGETWERLALIKARGIAGNRELVYEFLRAHQPFIYPKIATPDLLEQIANIKQRIEHDVVGVEKLHRDVKLGRGGIREIEFVVQTLQFIHGARNAFLQETSTLKALRALAELELVPQKQIVDLDRAYRFLRRTEHRLQIEAEQQTHTIPENAEHLQRIARSLGFDSAKQFSRALEREMRSVHEIFQHLVTAAVPNKTRDALGIFTDQSHAARAIDELERGSRGAHVSARTRQLSRKLRPLLLDALAQTVDPNATLNHFVRFADAYGVRSMLFELLVANPRLLELLTKTFDASRFAADLLVRNPSLVEETTRSGNLDSRIDVATHLRRLSGLTNEDVDLARSYRQSELLRLLLRDVLGLADLATNVREQSDLAEACLLFVNEIAGGKDLTIVALGKFGGRELSYGADLDVMFIADDAAAAQKLLAITAQPSAHGNLPRIDARLRPEGDKGPLVISLDAFARYHEGRGQLWEVQALTRARTIAGPQQKEFLELARGIWRRAGEDVDLATKIDNMLERIRRDRGSGSEFRDFKTGTGGIVEAEFLVQALQMSANIWEPNWARAAERLVDAGHLSQEDVVDLRESYFALRQIESVLRRYDNTSVSTLPNEWNTRRFGERDKYIAARRKIHELYCRRVTRAESMSAEQFEHLLQEKNTREQTG
jgi:glutamate-ammonia-ligase adenylyltransferase